MLPLSPAPNVRQETTLARLASPATPYAEDFAPRWRRGALLLNHPFLLAEVGEELAQFELPDRALDRLCREILRLHSLHPDLDAAALKLHLSDSGFGQEIAGILSSQVLNHAGFARPGADAEDVRLGWSHTKARLQERRLLSTQISEAERQAADGTDETWSRLQPLLQSKAEDDGAAGGGMD